MNKRFGGRTGVKPVHKALLAFDVENDPQTGDFICAGVYGKREDHHGKEHLIEEYFVDQPKFLQWLSHQNTETDRNLPFKLIAFNLAYDYWFINTICDDSKLLSADSRIITGRLLNGIPLIDLTNHVDGTLENWIGYLKLQEKGIYKPDLTDLKLRVQMDAHATYELGAFLENFYVNELDISFKLTVASAARELFNKTYFHHYWNRDNDSIGVKERESYRGGRVEVFQRGEQLINGFDVNSMYLSVMQSELLPDPNSARLSHPLELPTDRQYIAKVEVTVPDQHIGPLPYMSPKLRKLIFPTGTFTGTFCSPELDYAKRFCGTKTNKIYWVIKYRSYPYFKGYADFIWSKRQEYKHKGNTGMDKMIKKLGNSLYGSFGQRNATTGFYGKLSDYTGQLPEEPNIKPILINGEKYITLSATDKIDSNHTFPCIPSFITSFARLKLLKGLKANESNAVYCDTDSIKLLGEVSGIEEGGELGEWGAEEVKVLLSFHRAKVYGNKCKGVPKRAELTTETTTEKVFEYTKPNKMRESFRRNLTPNKWEKVVKHVNLIDDKRNWHENQSSPIQL